MEQDIDKKLYNDYLRGNTQAFELLYLRYKNKIQYFGRGALYTENEGESALTYTLGKEAGS
mgnify:CR=1 FL=1